MSDIILSVKNVTQKYGQTLALDRVNMHLKQGQIYGLVGNNGAGKTTLMRLITGQTIIQEGEIQLFGHTVNKGLCDVRKRTGALIEIPGFYDEMTAEQNLEYFRRQFGIKESLTIKSQDLK